MLLYIFPRNSADYNMSCNSLWVQFDKKNLKYDGNLGPKEFHKKYVAVEGTFNQELNRQFGNWNGGIQNVTRIYELKKIN